MSRLGVSIRSSYPVSDPRLGAQWIIERAIAARDAGFDSVYLGDQHCARTPYYQNTVMLGRILADWSPRAFGPFCVLPLWHPVLLAEQLGTLASLTEGNLVLQCSPGFGAAAFEGMGVSRVDRTQLFESSLSAIKSLLIGNEVTMTSPKVDGARVSPIPPRPIEIWIGGVAEAAIDRAARLGDGWIAAPSTSVVEALGQLAFYRSRRAIHGRDPGHASIRRDVHVDDDAERARRVARPALEDRYRSFGSDAPIVGCSDEVAESLVELLRSGFDEVLIRHIVDDQDQVLNSFGHLSTVRALVDEAVVDCCDG